MNAIDVRLANLPPFVLFVVTLGLGAGFALALGGNAMLALGGWLVLSLTFRFGQMVGREDVIAPSEPAPFPDYGPVGSDNE
jgi:hypothetical protein